MVTADGRSFFAGVLARDAFNGLRLWEQKLDPSPARGGFDFAAVPGSVRPIAAGKTLLGGHRQEAPRPRRGHRASRSASIPRPACPRTWSSRRARSWRSTTDAVRAVDLETRPAAAGNRTADAAALRRGRRRRRLLRRRRRRDARRPSAWSRASWPAASSAGDRRICPGWPRSASASITAACWSARSRRSTTTSRATSIHVLVGRRRRAAVEPRVRARHAATTKQARAMFVGDLLWVLEDEAAAWASIRGPARCSKTVRPAAATASRRWPPSRYLFAGEMDLTDLATGQVDANRITKAACSRDAGVVPANGLIYTFPKHCICWPMLRDYAALAPERPGGAPPTGRTLQASRPRRGPARRAADHAPAKTRPPSGPAIATMPCGAAARRRPCAARADGRCGPRRWATGPRARSPTTGGATTSSAARSARRSSPAAWSTSPGPTPTRSWPSTPRTGKVRWTLHGQRPRRHRADDPSRPVPVRLQERLGLLPAGRRRRAGLAAAGRPARRADRGLRADRIALAGAGQRAGGRRRGLLRRRAAAAGRRRHPRLRRRAGHAAASAGCSGSTACRRRSFYASSGLEFDNFDLLHREGDARGHVAMALRPRRRAR